MGMRMGLLAAALAGGAAVAGALPGGSVAPEFTGVDSNGVLHKLSEYRGKFVVLEWANQGCPYEQKLYLSGHMEALQKEWTGKGVVWLSVISSAKGQQGYVTPSQENEYLKKMKASPTAALLDPEGMIGHRYEAKTTPHMFVIDPAGKIVYQGAIDNRPTPDQADLKGADDYVSDALGLAMAGKPVAVSMTKPYGCSVKY
jgi:peroxiredoxin